MPTTLPPVRRPVPLGSRRAGEPLEALGGGYGVRVCGSGTQALALAIGAARRRSSTPRPEVILPAYGCPDLIAASIHAGVYPRLVDTAKGQWGYDLEQLSAAVSNDTVAIVAVNLLGVGDQASRLREIATAHDTLLIQDSAQHLPQGLPAQWLGDYVVLSFGRGKPLNLLRGGALLHTAGRTADLAASVGGPPTGLREWLLSRRLAGLAFNVATHPSLYGLSSRLLGASLGATRYQPLEAVHTASRALIGQVTAGLAGYRTAVGYDAAIWWEACTAWSSRGIEILNCGSQLPRAALRLRLALLAGDERICERVVTVLNNKGLGSSRMYGTSLERIADVPPAVAAQGPFPNAADLARRLFTLPTHSSVDSAAVRRARDAVCGILEAS